MTAVSTIRAKPVRKPRRVSFARAIEASADGVAPSAARLWRAGQNDTDKGVLYFSPRSAKLVMQAYEKRGNPLVWYYDHEDRIPQEKRGGAPMRGVCSAPSSMLSIRDSDAGPELWAEAIEWTTEAKRQIETGERRQLSPIAAFDEETREIVEILNVSLCTEGATHHGTLLASRGTSMEELIDKILAALEAKDWEALETLIQQAEAMDGGAPMAKMARAAMKAAKDDGGEEKPKPEETAEKRLAAALSRYTQAPAGRTAEPAFLAFSREMTARTDAAEKRAERAEREAKVGRVEGIIAANRECFDAVDERNHLRRADPEATREHVASLKRKAEEAKKNGTATLAAGREPNEAKPPKDPPGSAGDGFHGLSPAEFSAAVQMKVDPKDYAATKALRASQRTGKVS